MFHDADRITMAELLAFARAHGLDQDEYFSPSLDARLADLDFKLWGEDDDKVRWLACYPVRGGSEGWYVHVDRIFHDGHVQNLALGKFWSVDAAVDAAALLTKWLLTGRPALGEPPPGA